jgi:alkylhydroperoxidase family enzyme
MGHCEMGLAVAGLEEQEVQKVTQLLAGDWSPLKPEERAILEVARRSAADPSSVTTEDVQKLRDLVGDAKARAALWWIARCHYMTTVADAFQLPLEQGNPFLKMPR